MTDGMHLAVITSTDEENIRAALALVRDVFWEFEAGEYSPEGVAEFCEYIEYDNIYAAMQANRFVMWGCWMDRRLVGILAVRPPHHITLWFVEGSYQGRGIGRALMQEATAFFSVIGSTQVSVHSSPYAVPIYQSLGFAATGPEVTENGIRYTPMQLLLRPEDAPAPENPSV